MTSTQPARTQRKNNDAYQGSSLTVYSHGLPFAELVRSANGTRGIRNVPRKPLRGIYDLTSRRSSTGTSRSAASGSTNELPISSALSLIRSGNRIPWQQRDGEYLLHGLLKLQEGNDLAAQDIDDPHAASPFGFFQSLGDLDAAEDGRLANLRQADERQIADHFHAAREAFEVHDRLVAPVFRSTMPQAPGARFQQPQPAIVPPRRMGHRQPAGNDFVRLDVDENAAASFILAQPADRIGFAEGRDPSSPAVHNSKAVEVATIVRRQLRNKSSAARPGAKL